MTQEKGCSGLHSSVFDPFTVHRCSLFDPFTVHRCGVFAPVFSAKAGSEEGYPYAVPGGKATIQGVTRGSSRTNTANN
jgi:hypothetical protein